MMNKLYDLTLNTGHAANWSRSDANPMLMASLRPVLAVEGGPLPTLPGWYVETLVPLDAARAPRDGAAFFQFSVEPGLSKTPAVMAFLEWRPNTGAWDQALMVYRAQRRVLKNLNLWREPPDQPPPIPWLAILLTPSIAIPNLTARRL
jgi:hypothetical protein